MSWEEIERRTDLLIRVHGYMTVQVEGPAPWSYTIGAFESWDRPELLVVDLDGGRQAALLAAGAQDYALFGDLRDETLQLLDVEAVEVHGSHLRDGLVAGWEHRYSMAADTGDFVQLVPGSSWSGGCPGPRRRLDRPAG